MKAHPRITRRRAQIHRMLIQKGRNLAKLLQQRDGAGQRSGRVALNRRDLVLRAIRPGDVDGDMTVLNRERIGTLRTLCLPVRH